MGSPPQVWGKQSAICGLSIAIGFTPTGVGKTMKQNNAEGVVPVHPHRCGENAFAKGNEMAYQGSPPQVWGKHRD